jgi:hypothetical protein
MHRCFIGATASLVASSSAPAAFVSFVTTVTQVNLGQFQLDRVQLFARFNGPSDTVLNAFNLQYLGGSEVVDPYSGYYHRDNSDYNGGILSQQYGTWAPSLTGSATTNRPYDSFLTIGGTATATNTSVADPSWNSGGSGAHAGGPVGWNRADILNNGAMGWFNSSPPNLQGRVGIPPNTGTDVLIGQFVLDRGAYAGIWSITIGYSDGVPGTAAQFGIGTFQMGVPTPGTLALLGLAGLASRRRR